MINGSPSIAQRRLVNQQLVGSRFRDPADVVEWFGGIQAQDHNAARWALALRVAGLPSQQSIDRAIDDGRILRTHVLRPTWHFVAAADIHWILDLTAPRVHKALSWGHGKLGLVPKLRTTAAKAIEAALATHGALTRPALGEHLARAGVPAKGIALALLVIHAELERIICSGPRDGTQTTYALLAERVPKPRRLSGDEALGELALRYFRSHGPATLRDFVWWSGLRTADARRGIDIAGGRRETIEGLTYWSVGRSRPRALRSPIVHLVPVYDEYLVAYRDLEAVPRGKAFWGVLPQVIAIDGHVAGTWKVVRARGGVDVTLKPARTFTRAERVALDAAMDELHRWYSPPT